MKTKIFLSIPVLLAGITTASFSEVVTPTPPTAPINAGAYGFTDTSARISFKDLSDNEDGFRIDHVQGATTLTTHIPDDPTLSNRYEYVELTGLTPSTLYTVNIVAYNAAGEATPLTKSFRTLATPQTPAQPTNIGAYNFTSSSARISLLDNADNEDGFKIYDDKGNLLATAPAKAGSGEYVYVDLTGLKTCALSTINVVAYNANGESQASQKSFVTAGCLTDSDIPLAPSNVAVYNITTTSARVSFLDNANNEQLIDGFVIYDNDNNNTLATLPRSRFDQEYQYANITGLTPDTLYTIRVVAKNAAGEGSADLKSFRTLPLE